MSKQMVNVTALAGLLNGLLAVQEGTTAKKAKGRRGRKGQGRVKLSDEQKAKNAASNAAEAEALFKSKGYADCRANITIKTYKGWVEAGRKVKVGEKSLKHPTRGYPLFHISQTEEVAAQPQAEGPTQTAEGTATVQ